ILTVEATGEDEQRISVRTDGGCDGLTDNKVRVPYQVRAQGLECGALRCGRSHPHSRWDEFSLRAFVIIATGKCKVAFAGWKENEHTRTNEENHSRPRAFHVEGPPALLWRALDRLEVIVVPLLRHSPPHVIANARG